MGLYVWQAFHYRYANVDSQASLPVKEEGESAGLVVVAVDVGAALDGIGACSIVQSSRDIEMCLHLACLKQRRFA